MSSQDFKVVVVGDKNVGKSRLIHTFTTNVYPDESSKIHWTSNPEPKSVTVNGSSSNLIIYENENTNNEGFAFMARYNTNCNAVMIMYDVGDRNTFKNVAKWIEVAGEKCFREAVYMIVASKIDRSDRVVTTSEGESFAKDNKCLYVEVSSKSFKNVRECFIQLTEALQRRYGCIIL